MTICANSKISKVLKCFFSWDSVTRLLPGKSCSKYCTILKQAGKQLEMQETLETLLVS